MNSYKKKCVKNDKEKKTSANKAIKMGEDWLFIQMKVKRNS